MTATRRSVAGCWLRDRVISAACHAAAVVEFTSDWRPGRQRRDVVPRRGAARADANRYLAQAGSWSGRGSTQTDAFISDTGSLRLRWETRNETTPGTGTLRVTLHSDVSGRPLLLAVDVRGVGRDIAYVSEDPRPFFLAVESANLDWTIEAEEAVAATQGSAREDR
jgi:hypothetical protein